MQCQDRFAESAPKITKKRRFSTKNRKAPLHLIILEHFCCATYTDHHQYNLDANAVPED